MRGGWWKARWNITTMFARTVPFGYITPKDMLAGRQREIHLERDQKLEDARKQRQIRRQEAA